MGATNILVIADENRAAELAGVADPLESRDGVHLGDHDAATLSLLFTVVSGKDVTAESAITNLPVTELAVDDPDDGPWVYAVTPAFFEALARAGAADELAKAWSQAEMMEHFDRGELVVMIDALREVFERAAGAPILLWCCA